MRTEKIRPLHPPTIVRPLSLLNGSDRVERLLFHRGHQAVEYFIDRGPAWQLLHVVQPALHIGMADRSQRMTSPSVTNAAPK